MILFLLALQGVQGYGQFCSPFDPGFGTGGKAIGLTTTIAGRQANSRTVMVQQDNKIIQVISVFTGSYYNFGLIRYQANGTPDASFGSNGLVTTSIGKADSYANAGVIQPDGKIVLAGSGIESVNNNNNIALARFNPSGTLDSSFGTYGKLLTRIGKHDDIANAIALQPDGKILIAGSSGDSLNVPTFGILRFNSNGTIDSTFGQNGRIAAHYGPFIRFIGSVYFGQYAYENASAIKVQPDGKILVAGESYNASGCYDYYGGLYCSSIFAMTRYHSNGDLDTTFGVKGKVTDSVHLYYSNETALQADGKIVVIGSNYQNGFVTERYNANGTLDNSFGAGGVAIQQFPLPSYGAAATGLVIQPDGKIIVAGSVYKNSGSDFGVVRYTTEGRADTSFNQTGSALLHVGETATTGDYVSGMALQGNKIVVGGTSYINNNSVIVLTRFLETIPTLTPVITADGPIRFCVGGNVHLSSSEHGIIQWYRNNVPIANAIDTVYTVIGDGSYTVRVANSNGCGLSAPLFVTVTSLPSKPPINWNGTQFSTTSGYAQYQWLHNDTVITGAGTNIYTPLITGRFRVRVIDQDNCSNISDTYTLVVTALGNITVGEASIRFYPNPARTILYVDVAGLRNNKLEAELYDLSGRLVQKQQLKQTRNQIQLNRLSSGIYQLVINNSVERSTVKIMVTR
jgi:uncharacterized delta-60 repeat protein